MFTTSTHRFVVVLLALVSRRADARLMCMQFGRDPPKYFVIDPDNCRVNDFNDYVNGGEKLMSGCTNFGSVSFSLCGSTRPSLLRRDGTQPAEASWFCAAL